MRVRGSRRTSSSRVPKVAGRGEEMEGGRQAKLNWQGIQDSTMYAINHQPALSQTVVFARKVTDLPRERVKLE